MNKRKRPVRKKASAIFSRRLLLGKLPLIDKNERMLLAIKSRVEIVVSSSINVACAIFKSFREVRTTKQRPRRLDEAFRICGDFWFLFSNVASGLILRNQLYRNSRV
jgi:hypothetical protein